MSGARTEEARLSVSVIVPALNASATLDRTLSALAAQAFDGGYEVIVVDDGSDDDTAAIAERANVKLIRQARRGPAAARNAGVDASRGEILAFTDADCYPSPHWLAHGVRAMEAADLVQGRVEPEPRELGPWDRTISVEGETGLYETANLFLRREVFDRIGGFEAWLEPEIGKPLAEDMWLGWRARRSGARSAFCADALVHHAVFDRGALGWLDERRRLRYFPAIAAQMPELRRQFFFAHTFLSRRSAAFDAAVLGVAVAAARRSPWPLLIAAPYARMLGADAVPSRRRAPLVAAVKLAGDAIGLACLLRGSARYRSLLI